MWFCLLLGSLGTFALLKSSTLWWGTLIIKIKSYLIKSLYQVFTKLCLYVQPLWIEHQVPFYLSLCLLFDLFLWTVNSKPGQYLKTAQSICYKLVQGFRATCFFTSHYNTKGYDTISDVI